MVEDQKLRGGGSVGSLIVLKNEGVTKPSLVTDLLFATLKILARLERRNVGLLKHAVKSAYFIFCTKAIMIDTGQRCVIRYTKLNHLKPDCFCVSPTISNKNISFFTTISNPQILKFPLLTFHSRFRLSHLSPMAFNSLPLPPPPPPSPS